MVMDNQENPQFLKFYQNIFGNLPIIILQDIWKTLKFDSSDEEFISNFSKIINDESFSRGFIADNFEYFSKANKSNDLLHKMKKNQLLIKKCYLIFFSNVVIILLAIINIHFK
jgi:hypothetical protein